MDCQDEQYDEEDLHEFLFNHIRSSLNIDNETLEDAWNSFRQIGGHYILEGKKLDWLACSLYVSCRKCITQTGRGQSRIEGNMVSLTRILRTCNISLVRFFNKIKNWIDMASLPIDMRKKIDQIEKNFNVTSVIFKKYKPIFEDVFKYPMLPCRFNPKNRKIRKQPLNSLDVFTFCWTLFVFVKSRFSKIGDDLVNSYHLLLVCIDYCFSSVLSFDNYRDIVNTNFYDMLTKELKHDLRSLNNDNRVSIIDTLCKKWNGIPVEVKHIRKHWFKSLLKKLIDKNDLRKKTNGIIDNDAIDYNFKFIKKEYEDFVLTIGDFDECVFLNETASEELGTSDLSSQVEIDEKLFQQQQQQQQQQKQQQVSHESSSKNLVPVTPLSSKQYLASRTPVKKALTPISSATTSISRLHTILMNHGSKPSKDLERIFQLCDNDPKTRIKEIIKRMGDVFAEAYSKNNQNQSIIRSTEEYQCLLTTGDEFATKRRVFAETFFYYILEKILKSELSKRIPESQLHQSLSKMVSSDFFIRSLFACSLEIILFSYNLCNRVFPWILEIYDDQPELKIPPFFFYKVIEPIIREEQGLSRDIVKHLNTIEEKILDSLAWTNDSPIWILLSKTSPPTCSEVSLNIFNHEKKENGVSFLMSPAVKSELNYGSFLNAYTNFPKGNVKRQLFTTNSNSNDVSQNSQASQDVSVIRSTKIVNQNNQIKEESDENLATNKSSPTSTPVKNQRNSQQLGLFFRKVYYLASLRLSDLFKRLQITSDDVQLKIWTCLEHALQTHTYLMCDHHLDQIIMCCIYGVARININGDRSIKFQDILEVYRLQPQATNLVYRNVLLSALKKNDETNEQQQQQKFNSSISNEGKDKSGTIIDFYNKIFIPNLTEAYIMKFSADEKNPNIKLSPMPRNKFSSPNIHSPLRCVPNYPVFVSPLRSSTYTSPSKPITYRLNNNLNTSKDLEHINNMMKSSATNLLMIPNNNHATCRDMKASIATAMISMANLNAKRVSKRILQDDNDSDQNNSSSNKSFCSINRKIREIVSERQIMSASSSANASASVSGDESNDSIPFSNTNNLNIRRGFRTNPSNNHSPSNEINNNIDGGLGLNNNDNHHQQQLPNLVIDEKQPQIVQPIVNQMIQQQQPNGEIGPTFVHHQNVIVPSTTVSLIGTVITNNTVNPISAE